MTTTVQCDVDVLSIKELTPVVRQSVKNIIEKEGFLNYTINVKDISTYGGNYMGTLQTVSIKGKTENGDDKKLNLFLKSIIPIDEVFSVVTASKAYAREAYIYNDLFKIIDKIQDKYEIPRKDRFSMVKSYSETNDKVIILEDLSKSGFKTYDRLDVIPLKFIELAIEQIAKLHALSFVLKKDHLEYFENNIKPLHSMYNFTSEFNDYLRKACDKAKETLDSDVGAKIDKFYVRMTEQYKKYFHVPIDEAVCLIQVDFRIDNILVKENNDDVSEVMIIDYQLAQYGHPVTDFLFFVFTTTDQQFRKEHLQDLKDLYYRTFENFLNKFNIDAKDVYARKQFENDYTDKLDYGLMSFICLMPILFCKKDDFPDLANGLQGVGFNLDEKYKDRLHGMVDDFIRWGYL